MARSQHPFNSLSDLVDQLDADRAWLLEQIDGGRWPELRLDLAALERELGQLLTKASELIEEGRDLDKEF